AERIPPLYKSLVERIGAQPGVQGVAFASIGLLEGNEWDSTMTIEGYDAKPGEQRNPYCNAVSAGYFKTMGIAVLRGREFDGRDEGAAAGRPESERRARQRIPPRDRQPELREAVLRRPGSDRAAHRVRAEPRHADAARDRRRGARRQVHRRSRRHPATGLLSAPRGAR